MCIRGVFLPIEKPYPRKDVQYQQDCKTAVSTSPITWIVNMTVNIHQRVGHTRNFHKEREHEYRTAAALV